MSREASLLKLIQRKSLPRHIAVIMDGNGRWAESRGLPRILGHRAGTESVREIVRTCGSLGIKVLTLFAFSTENWVRPKSEIRGLMRLLARMLTTEVEELNKSGVRLMATGRIHELPGAVRLELSRAIEKLKHNRGLILNLALNYGGRQEIVDAVRMIIKEKVKNVDEKSFQKFLYTRDLPDPDLMIRTSGEMRISNFLLYQIAYAELYVTKTHWPDFKRKHLYQAVLEYQKRERRFGGR